MFILLALSGAEAATVPSDIYHHPPKESTYTITSVMRIGKPVNIADMNDDCQDARLLSEDAVSCTVEITYYPLFNPPVPENPNWRTEDKSKLAGYLCPTPNENWDETMRRDLLAELHQAGIEPEHLTDRQLVEKVAPWAQGRMHQHHLNTAPAWYAPGGKLAIYPPERQGFEDMKPDEMKTLPDHFFAEQEILGRSMFYKKLCGTCGSYVTYLNTLFKALGIPIRGAGCIPPFDPSDDAQYNMMRDAIHHHQVRILFQKNAVHGQSSGTMLAHGISQVYIGHRWVSVIFGKVGDSCLGLFGLTTHTSTGGPYDPAGESVVHRPAPSANEVQHQARQREAVFTSWNNYMLLSVKDHFGSNAHLDNSQAVQARAPAPFSFTINGLYLPTSSEIPKEVRDAKIPRHLLLSCQAPTTDKAELKAFFETMDRGFVLTAPGQPEIRGEIQSSFNDFGNFHDFGAVLFPDDLEKLAPNVAYGLRITSTNKIHSILVAPKIKPLTMTKADIQAMIAASEQKTATIRHVYPDAIDRSFVDVDVKDQLVISCEEWTVAGIQGMRAFLRRAGSDFELVARGCPTVKAKASGRIYNGWTAMEIPAHAYGLIIAPEDLDKVISGTTYTLRAINTNDTYRWDCSRANFFPLDSVPLTARFGKAP